MKNLLVSIPAPLTSLQPHLLAPPPLPLPQLLTTETVLVSMVTALTGLPLPLLLDLNKPCYCRLHHKESQCRVWRQQPQQHL